MENINDIKILLMEKKSKLKSLIKVSKGPIDVLHLIKELNYEIEQLEVKLLLLSSGLQIVRRKKMMTYDQVEDRLDHIQNILEQIKLRINKNTSPDEELRSDWNTYKAVELELKNILFKK